MEHRTPSSAQRLQHQLHQTLDEIFELHAPQHRDEAYRLHCEALELARQIEAQAIPARLTSPEQAAQLTQALADAVERSSFAHFDHAIHAVQDLRDAQTTFEESEEFHA